MNAPISPPVVTAKPTVPSLASISTTSVPSTLMPNDCRLCAVFGIAGHRRGDVIVDPVAARLVVIVGAAAADGEGAHLLDGGHGHDMDLRARAQ